MSAVCPRLIRCPSGSRRCGPHHYLLTRCVRVVARGQWVHRRHSAPCHSTAGVLPCPLSCFNWYLLCAFLAVPCMAAAGVHVHGARPVLHARNVHRCHRRCGNRVRCHPAASARQVLPSAVACHGRVCMLTADVLCTPLVLFAALRRLSVRRCRLHSCTAASWRATTSPTSPALSCPAYRRRCQR